MARFDVHQSRSGAGLIVDVQADLHRDLATRVVVPLRPRGPERQRPFPRLEPVFEVGGADHLFATTLMTAVATRELGDHVASLAEHEYQIQLALDLLLTGV